MPFDNEERRYHLVPALNGRNICCKNNSQRKAFRTKPCRYFQNGSCRYGRKCRFLHNRNVVSENGHSMNGFMSVMEKKFEDIQTNMKHQNNLLQEQSLEISNLKKLLSKFHQTNNKTSNAIPAYTQTDLEDISSYLEIFNVSSIGCKAERDGDFEAALEEIESLKSQIEIEQQMNMCDHEFYEEKIKDLEYQLTELSSNFGDHSVLRSLSQDLERSQILESQIKALVSVGDLVHCEITGELGEVRRKYSHKIGVKFQSGYRTCCISEITKMETHPDNDSQHYEDKDTEHNVLNVSSLSNNEMYQVVDPSWCKGDIVRCQNTGDVGKIVKIRNKQVDVQFQAGIRTCYFWEVKNNSAT